MKRRILAFALVLALLCAFLPLRVAAAGTPRVKNIILMVPDGGGFGNFDLADAVKRGGGGIAGQRTPITTNAIAGETHDGLYLADYLIGTSRTRSSDSSVTDSAAGGTAITSGYRTLNGRVGLDPSGVPLPSLLEAAQADGKATGILTTSYWKDATPASAAAHVEHRSQTDKIAVQMLRHDLDIVLGGGSDCDSSGSVTAAQQGYTVVTDAATLAAAVRRGEKRIWSRFGEGNKIMTTDRKPSSQPTLLEMTKAAIEVLSTDADGFFLLVEGGCVDKGAHGQDARTAAAEYLAFDEAFAYAVNWAKRDGSTAVLAVPDHDTGALDVNDMEKVLRELKKGEKPTDSITWNRPGDHSSQNVGIWYYGPEAVRGTFMEAAGLPTEAGTVRTGAFYSGTTINEDYATDNCRLAAGLAAIAGLDMTPKRLFTPVALTTEGVAEDSAVLTLSDGTRQGFPYGIAVRSEESTPRLYLPEIVARRLQNNDAPFTDVAQGAWYEPAVRTAFFRFWMEGTAADRFSPEEPMSRAMFVTVLWRIAGQPDGRPTAFTDVPEGKWYSRAVAWANAEGIVIGTSRTTFSPQEALTREQLATILLRYGKKNGMVGAERGSVGDFADGSSVSPFALDAMRWAIGAGVINGADGRLLPKNNATRAETAAVLVRFMKT